MTCCDIGHVPGKLGIGHQRGEVRVQWSARGGIAGANSRGGCVIRRTIVEGVNAILLRLSGRGKVEHNRLQGTGTRGNSHGSLFKKGAIDLVNHVHGLDTFGNLDVDTVNSVDDDKGSVADTRNGSDFGGEGNVTG